MQNKQARIAPTNGTQVLGNASELTLGRSNIGRLECAWRPNLIWEIGK